MDVKAASVTKRFGLSGNALKVIAIIAMTIDHVAWMRIEAYRRCGNMVSMDSLEGIGEEVTDPYNLEDDAANRIFKKQIYRCLPQMNDIDRIIIRCMVLHEREVTERQLAALISKAIGQKYSHQAVHKRIPAAAKRLADLMHYPY